MPPVQALHNMAELTGCTPLAAAGRAVFVIQNASLVRQGDTITGNFEVELDIYTTPMCVRLMRPPV